MPTMSYRVSKLRTAAHADFHTNVRRGIVLASLCLYLASAAPLAAAEPVELEVMSFNIRYAYAGHSEESTDNNWNDASHPRRERVIRVIRENHPDILGVQEARHGQIVDLREALGEFDFYGIGRDDGKTEGEYSGIFYRKDRFERGDAGSFWLSATPDKPGTTFATEENAVPRIASWVKLKDMPTGQQFFVLNAHWDHISVPARRASARLIRERLAKLGGDLPIIVMGDFNAREGSAEVEEIIGGQDGKSFALVDSYRALHPERQADEATFGGFKGTVAGRRIDYILCSRDWKPIRGAIVRTSYDGLWPSDHYPIVATLRLEGER